MVHHRKTAGVTLIEVNLAMGVLLFGIISVASLFPTGLTVAEDGFRTTDAAFIASMAKSQLEVLKNSPEFDFPQQGSRNEREGRLSENGPLNPTLTMIYKVLLCKPLYTEGNTPQDGLSWPPGVWAGSFLLITSGRETGKVLAIQTNTASALTLFWNVARCRLRKNDTFRIIQNKGGTKCIPKRFLTDGARIPSINGIALGDLRRRSNNPTMSLADLPCNSALHLDMSRYCRYSYAIVLDSPERGSSSLFRAHVLIYKDFDPELRMNWWKNNPPIEFYSFFYRRY